MHRLMPHAQEHRPALSFFKRTTNGTYPSHCPFSYVTMRLLKKYVLITKVRLLTRVYGIPPTCYVQYIPPT